MTSSNAGAGASSGGASSLRDLRFPRPGEAHRTVYRVNRSVLRRPRIAVLAKPAPFPFGLEASSKAAVLEAPLTGEATSGGQTSEVRMTVPRPFGKLCLISTTIRLPHPFPSYTYVLTFL